MRNINEILKICLDEFDDEEDEKEIKFKCFWMTEEEYNNMPLD